MLLTYMYVYTETYHYSDRTVSEHITRFNSTVLLAWTFAINVCPTDTEPLHYYKFKRRTGPHILQLAPEPENGFHILQYDRTGTNMFYEWSLKKRCLR